ncbi:MAG: hypothetical protein WAL96_18095 [Candidatus Sulfotelmatobacter sp.]
MIALTPLNPNAAANQSETVTAFLLKGALVLAQDPVGILLEGLAKVAGEPAVLGATALDAGATTLCAASATMSLGDGF